MRGIGTLQTYSRGGAVLAVVGACLADYVGAIVVVPVRAYTELVAEVAVHVGVAECALGGRAGTLFT